MLIGHHEEFKADISSVSPLSEQLEELWAVCVFICIIRYMKKLLSSDWLR